MISDPWRSKVKSKYQAFIDSRVQSMVQSRVLSPGFVLPHRMGHSTLTSCETVVQAHRSSTCHYTAKLLYPYS